MYDNKTPIAPVMSVTTLPDNASNLSVSNNISLIIILLNRVRYKFYLQLNFFLA